MAPRKRTAKNRTNDRWLFVATVAVVIIVGIALRLTLLQSTPLYEPDGFFDYAVLQQAVSNNFVVGNTLLLSGFPNHNPIGEPAGEYYITLMPYYVLRYFGMPLLSLMQTMPLVFAIAYMLLAYPLTKMLTKSRSAALLSMFFVAISAGSIARTAATIYRGDTFAPLFLILALILLHKSFSSKDNGKKWAFAILAPAVLSLSVAVWNGASFAYAVYDAVLALSIMFFFLKSDSDGAKSAMIASIAYLSAYICNQIILYVGLSTSVLPLVDQSFIIIYIGLIVSSYLAAWSTCNRRALSILGGARRRAALLISVLIVLSLVVYLFFSGYLISIVSYGSANPGHGDIAQNLVNATTQELQPTTLTFLIETFSFQIFFALAGVLMLLYSLMKKYDRSIAYGAAIALAYLLVTSLLQATAIRYEALLSMPLAVLSGYAVVTGASMLKGRSFPVSKGARAPAVNIYYGFVAVLILFCLGTTYLQYASASPADGINPQLLSAMDWLSTNTPQNATVLTFWTEGSIVEGWAHRQSYVDSVGGENFTRIEGLSNYLMNSSPDPGYLYNIGRPQYLLVRYSWLYETSAIAYEGNAPDSNDYVYLPMQMVANGTDYYNFSFTIPPYNDTVSLSYSNGAPLFTTKGFKPSSIVYYNTSSGVLSQTSTGQSSGQSLMVYRNGQGRVTGVGVLGNELLSTNAFRFLFRCDPSCTTGNVTMDRIFSNNDTIIYRLSYQ